jgi:antitoxin component of MazEF toxin-antitoxin module
MKDKTAFAKTRKLLYLCRYRSFTMQSAETKSTPEPSDNSSSLVELFADITDQNIHLEIDSGSPVGKEIW